jgi:hypothetical protein
VAWKRASSPQMVRSMLGHGRSMTRAALVGAASVAVLSRSTLGTTPKNGRQHEPGLAATAPGSGVIMMAPVSVCHHVSTMGQRSPPMTSRYHIQASGLMGSPTVPSRRSVLRSWRCGCSSPHLMKARMAVGAV